MKLDNRLNDISKMVDKCNLVIDVGTDHGYLPIFLVSNNIANKAIASDVAIGPLSKASENINLHNLNDRIETRLTNGLKDLPKADTVIIAGMGGNLIVDILKENIINHSIYILEPNNNVELVRRYLTNNGYKIIDEKVSFESNKYYEIIKAIKGNQNLSEDEITFGPINLIKREENFIKMINNKINQFSSILTDFKGSNNEKDRINNILRKLKEIIHTC